ncbi:MAG: hypothetical protein SOZ59_13690 [Candidatus Limivivens sp.]|nr:hypothetical protein [Candidatus Limivivens sp.]
MNHRTLFSLPKRPRLALFPQSFGSAFLLFVRLLPPCLLFEYWMYHTPVSFTINGLHLVLFLFWGLLVPMACQILPRLKKRRDTLTWGLKTAALLALCLGFCKGSLYSRLRRTSLFQMDYRLYLSLLLFSVLVSWLAAFLFRSRKSAS